MKKIVVFVVCIVLGCIANGQTGVNFEALTMNKALVKARKENKQVLVYYHAPYGLSMHMDEAILSQKKVYDFVNANFVTVKIEREQGGKEIIEKELKYIPKCVPLFLILDSKGKIQHKIPVIRDVDYFLQQLEVGKDQQKCWAHLHDLYERNRISKKELSDYYLLAKGLEEECSGIRTRLYEQLTDIDRMQIDFWSLITSSEYGSEEFKFLMAHLEEIKQNVGEKEVETFAHNCCRLAINYYYNMFLFNLLKDLEKTKLPLQELHDHVSKLDMKNEGHLMERVEILVSYANGDTKKILNIVDSILASDVEQTVLAMGIRLVERQGNKEDFARVIALGDDLLTKSPENSRQGIQSVLDRFKKKYEEDFK